MHSATAALILTTLALVTCNKGVENPDFPEVPRLRCSLMDPPDCRVPVPPKRIAP